MKIQFLGAVGTVTGSKYLVSSGTGRILVDCGLFQGPKEWRLRNWDAPPWDPTKIDAVVLTHAHIDHTGYLPLLAKKGFRGPIYATRATRDLCALMLPDSGKIQEEEAEYSNRKGFSKHHPALPLYSSEDARRVMDQFKVVPLVAPFDLTSRLRCRLARSGHLLGSAFVRLEEEGGPSLLFSGDLGRPRDLLLHPPDAVEAADYLVVESTYGGRFHVSADPLAQLEAIILKTYARQGVVLVPCFAVGRAQTLLYCLHRLRAERRIPDVPIYLNSPMAVDATEIFRAHADEHGLTPKECEAMCSLPRYVTTAEESKALNLRQGPMIILSASGMATGGRVLHHLKAFGPDERNTILFTGYQAAGTRGATLLQGGRFLKIHGAQVPIHAEVATLGGLSGHADQGEILAWLSGLSRAPKRTFITHGDPDSARSLQRAISDSTGWSPTLPAYLEEFDLP